MKKIDSTNYKDWLEKGNHNLEDAKRLFKNGGYTDTICFLCQQAVEKYLKTYLITKKAVPGPIHHLEDLTRHCAKFEKDFLKFLDVCSLLSRYYIETRYPPLVPIEYTKEETAKAIAIAEEIIEFIENRLEE